MKDTFILNVIHRPEMVPEYAEKVTGQGKEENITRKALLTESLDIFKLQQEIAHKNNIKTTIQMTYASLFNVEAVEIAKLHHAKYGDEIALSLLGLPCKEFRDKYKTKDFCIWMFSESDKRSIIDDVFSMFYQTFGFYPSSTGSYYLDAYSISYIKNKYPSVTCAVATCWEEGPKAYHTCNNSWYTFMDGGPWAPWIPSKNNTHVPAKDKQDDIGIVAIPHLSRDLIACFDGNGSNFGTHPQNVLRGMIYQDNEYPYLYNLIDQYRHLAKYNNGFSYNMMFVGPAWLNKLGRWEAPFELLKKSYEDGMAYYGKLKQEGKLIDMTMKEFASFYRKNKTYVEPEVALWKDILYGSDKQYFWYSDPYFRTCLDFNQCGAMIDLRPYVASLPWKVGIGTSSVSDCSYPYLIQANYRAGYFTHYAGEGTIKSCKVKFNGEEVDLALCRSMAKFSRVGEDIVLTCNPVDVEFTSLTVSIVSKFIFKKNSGKIVFIREIVNDIGTNEVTFEEYMTFTYGINEYAQDMSGIKMNVIDKNGQNKSLNYEYKNREISVGSGQLAMVEVPQVNTKVYIGGDNDLIGVEEGYAFSPMVRMSIKKVLKNKEAITTWLKLEKAN